MTTAADGSFSEMLGTCINTMYILIDSLSVFHENLMKQENACFTVLCTLFFQDFLQLHLHHEIMRGLLSSSRTEKIK